MKRFLSILLCLCMIISTLPVMVGAENSTDSSNMQVLESLGFNTNTSVYDTNGVKKGTSPVDTRYNLYADVAGTTYKLTAGQKSAYTKNNVEYMGYDLTGPEAVWTNSENNYFVSTVFAPTSTRIEDYIAKVHLASGSKGGKVLLTIYDAKGNKIINGYDTGGQIVTKGEIDVLDFDGIISVTAGDFDGDDKDELAIYTPNNYNETQDGKTPADISLCIFDVDVTAKTVSQKQKINIGDGTEWQYSYIKEGNNPFLSKYYKQWFSIPKIALCGEDVNGDGIDDIMATVSFSELFRNGIYAGTDLFHYNSCVTSVAEVFEGRENTNVNWAVKHRILATETMSLKDGLLSKDGRYICQKANITVGDVTSEGSKEIIIAGNALTAFKDTVSGDFKMSYSESELIVGFTNYENLKRKDPVTQGGEYRWTAYDKHYTKYGITSLCAYQHYGFGKPDKIFAGGVLFDYDSEENILVFESDLYALTIAQRPTGTAYVGKATAGNIAEDMFGREVLAFPLYYEANALNKYDCDIATCKEVMSLDGMSNNDVDLYDLYKNKTKPEAASVICIDDVGKTSYVTYDGNNTEVYFSDVEVLAIMQAPPVYEEINDDSYIGNSGTGFSKSVGSSSAETQSNSLTAGIITGYEEEFSILGMKQVGGIDIELKLAATSTYANTKEVSYEYTSGFGTSGATDAVTLFTVPYVRYNCQMYSPKYIIPTQAEYNGICQLRDELENNLLAYAETGEEQTSNTAIVGLRYFEYKYTAKVNDDNADEQLAVYQNICEEAEYIEKAVKDCGKGGIYSWGQVVDGATKPYHYNVPQTPLLVTVDAKTYDAIAETSPRLEKVYGNVFMENYRPGDPSTYAKSTNELAVTNNLLTAQTNMGSSGFLSNIPNSSGTSQTQTISVSRSDSTEIGWGAELETSVVGNAVGVKAGVTISADKGGSTVSTTTNGNEYSGTVVGLPGNVPGDYAYDWQLVSYNTTLNGNTVPVVGYLTRLNNIAPPPSVAQNISVENLTDTSATLTWENGERAADYYKISRVDADGNNPVPIANNIVPVDGKCSYDISNLQPSGVTPSTSYYVIESYNSSGKKSIASEIISVTTMPEGFAVVMSVEGIEKDVIYRDGKNLSAKLNIDGNEGYDTFYQWQVLDGNEWVDLDGQNAKTMNFKISTLDNNKKVRCAVTMFIGSRSYRIYSAPSTLHCTNLCNGYRVDWADDGKSVTITAEEGATPASVYLKAENAGGISKIMYEPSSANGVTFNTSDVASDDMRIYIWENNLAPVTYPFVR